MLATSSKEREANYHNYYWKIKLEVLQPGSTGGEKDREMFSALDSQESEKSCISSVSGFCGRIRDISEETVILYLLNVVLV